MIGKEMPSPNAIIKSSRDPSDLEVKSSRSVFIDDEAEEGRRYKLHGPFTIGRPVVKGTEVESGGIGFVILNARCKHRSYLGHGCHTIAIMIGSSDW